MCVFNKFTYKKNDTRIKNKKQNRTEQSRKKTKQFANCNIYIVYEQKKTYIKYNMEKKNQRKEKKFLDTENYAYYFYQNV